MYTVISFSETQNQQLSLFIPALFANRKIPTSSIWIDAAICLEYLQGLTRKPEVYSYYGFLNWRIVVDHTAHADSSIFSRRTLKRFHLCIHKEWCIMVKNT